MARKTTGLSLDLIIHPGETLQEVLDNQGISQKELAKRTELSPAYVSMVIGGQKSISARMAKKLEYALGINSKFWANLQSNYDQELQEYRERESISENELAIVGKLKQIIDYAQSLKIIPKVNDPISQVMEMRKTLKVSNLSNIPDVALGGCYRKAKEVNIDIYVLFAWQRMCEHLAENIQVTSPLSVGKLERKIPDIKAVMFESAGEIQMKLKSIFAECGIAFCIIKNFTGAPVQGFISKRKDDALVLCTTIRGKYADIFWFTLFHEIAHILNMDFDCFKIDFLDSTNDMETQADLDASNYLIPPAEYERFINEGNFSANSIESFACANGVQPYIVIGRLQRDRFLSYKTFASKKVRYEWADK